MYTSTCGVTGQTSYLEDLYVVHMFILFDWVSDITMFLD